MVWTLISELLYKNDVEALRIICHMATKCESRGQKLRNSYGSADWLASSTKWMVKEQEMLVCGCPFSTVFSVGCLLYDQCAKILQFPILVELE